MSGADLLRTDIRHPTGTLPMSVDSRSSIARVCAAYCAACLLAGLIADPDLHIPGQPSRGQSLLYLVFPAIALFKLVSGNASRQLVVFEIVFALSFLGMLYALARRQGNRRDSSTR